MLGRVLKQTSNDAGNRFADDGTMALTMAGSGSDHETEELALNRPPYTYDALSFRRKRFTTEKLSTGKLLRRVAHHYDAVGNNVETKDASTHAAYFGEATMAASADGAYTYDAVGNIAHMRHRASPHGSQTYDEGTNRLATTTHHDGTRTYSHDAHGNTADMPHLAGVDRDFADWRWPVEKQSGGQPAHDASGRRVRKVYEEYHPYGTSAYRSFGSADVSAKRYRYTGKERDEETGLYYHGARYYMCWLARWASADPLGVGADGPGLYTYVRGSPVVLSDPSGMDGEDPSLVQLRQRVSELEGLVHQGAATAEQKRELASGGAELAELEFELAQRGDSGRAQILPGNVAHPVAPATVGTSLDQSRRQITIPHVSGLHGDQVLGQIPSIEDTGSTLDNATNYVLGWIYNAEALAISAVFATIEGTDKAAVKQLKKAGLSDVDIQALRDLTLLHGPELALALKNGVVGVRQLITHSRMVAQARTQIPVIRGTITGFRDPSNVGTIKESMRAGTFAYHEDRAIIAIIRDEKGTLHVTVGGGGGRPPWGGPHAPP